MRHDYGTLLSVCRALAKRPLKLARHACLKLVDRALAPNEARGIDTRRSFPSRQQKFTFLATDDMNPTNDDELWIGDVPQSSTQASDRNRHVIERV
jgi:hypothetical protein